jgi:hypothetical protein
MILYSLSKLVPDEVLKGHTVRQYVILSGPFCGKRTTSFGSHCLTDLEEVVTARQFIDPELEVKQYRLEEVHD